MAHKHSGMNFRSLLYISPLKPSKLGDRVDLTRPNAYPNFLHLTEEQVPLILEILEHLTWERTRAHSLYDDNRMSPMRRDVISFLPAHRARPYSHKQISSRKALSHTIGGIRLLE